MKQKKNRIFYGSEHDIFAVHKGFSKDEGFDGNIVIGDLVLDMSTRGRVRGIEILNASDFLEEFGIGETILNNLTDAEFTAAVTESGIMLSLTFKTKNRKKMPAKIAVPLYNEKLVVPTP